MDTTKQKEILRKQFNNYHYADALAEIATWSAKDLKTFFEKIGSKEHGTKATLTMVLSDLVKVNWNYISAKAVKTVDATPSWESLSQQMIEWIQSGNSEQHQQASEMIFQMAKIADAYRENQSLFEASGDLNESLTKCLSELKFSLANQGAVLKLSAEKINQMIKENSLVAQCEKALAKADGKK